MKGKLIARDYYLEMRFAKDELDDYAEALQVLNEIGTINIDEEDIVKEYDKWALNDTGVMLVVTMHGVNEVSWFIRSLECIARIHTLNWSWEILNELPYGVDINDGWKSFGYDLVTEEVES